MFKGITLWQMFTVRYGKDPSFIGNSTISIGRFNSYVTNYQRITPISPGFMADIT